MRARAWVHAELHGSGSRPPRAPDACLHFGHTAVRGFSLQQAPAPVHLTGLLEEVRTNRSPRPKRVLVKPPEVSLVSLPTLLGGSEVSYAGCCAKAIPTSTAGADKTKTTQTPHCYAFM